MYSMINALCFYTLNNAVAFRLNIPVLKFFTGLTVLVIHENVSCNYYVIILCTSDGHRVDFDVILSRESSSMVDLESL